MAKCSPWPSGPAGASRPGIAPDKWPSKPWVSRKRVAHIGNGVDAHRFQRGIEEHRAVKTRCVVAHFGHDIGVAQHHHGSIGFRAGGEAAGVARGFGAGHLQREITQRIRDQQGLVGRLYIAGIASRRELCRTARRIAHLFEIRHRFREILNSLAKRRGCLGFDQVFFRAHFLLQDNSESC